MGAGDMSQENIDRAKKLAGIFGWELVENYDDLWCIPWKIPYRGKWASPKELFSDAGIFLPWLLSELPKRGLYPEIYWGLNDRGYEAIVSYDGKKVLRSNINPLLALVDAVIASHGKGKQ